MKWKVNREFQGSKPIRTAYLVFGARIRIGASKLARKRTCRKRVLHISLADLKIESVAIGRFEFRMVCESVIQFTLTSCCVNLVIMKGTCKIVQPSADEAGLLCVPADCVAFKLLCTTFTLTRYSNLLFTVNNSDNIVS